MEELNLQINLNGHWQDAAVLTLPDLKQGRKGGLALHYHPNYVFEHAGSSGMEAIGAHFPVDDFLATKVDIWPALVDDLIPAGYARKRIITLAGLGALESSEQDCLLLKHHTIAPVGNIRIKESQLSQQLPQLRFSKDLVLERHVDFVDYAFERGAASGGASGAGGEAPKYLVRQTQDQQIWIDSYQNQPDCLDPGYLVKFARNNGSMRDQHILQMEHAYYHFAQSIGFNTISLTGMELHKHQDQNRTKWSLWLPRFDMGIEAQTMHRYGLESVYSLLNAQPGSTQSHLDALQAIDHYLSRFPTYDRQAIVVEYLKRDLLNVILGNSDNHCRNIAVLKRPQGCSLAPIYDLAPMKADDQGVIRTTRWPLSYERGGDFDYPAICQQVGEQFACEPAHLRLQLQELAEQLRGVKSYLQQCQIPDEMLELPALGFDFIDDKLQRWGLL